MAMARTALWAQSCPMGFSSGGLCCGVLDKGGNAVPMAGRCTGRCGAPGELRNRSKLCLLMVVAMPMASATLQPQWRLMRACFGWMV